MSSKWMTILMVMIAAVSTAAAFERNEGAAVPADGEEDALVFFLHSRGKPNYVYSGETLVAVTAPNGYAAARLEPGTHRLWTQRSRIQDPLVASVYEIEFEAGSVSYLQFDKADGFTEIDAVAGAGRVANAKFRVTLSDDDLGKIEKHLGKYSLDDANNPRLAWLRLEEAKQARSEAETTALRDEADAAARSFVEAARRFDRSAEMYEGLVKLTKKRKRNTMLANIGGTLMAGAMAATQAHVNAKTSVSGVGVGIQPTGWMPTGSLKDTIGAYRDLAEGARHAAEQCRSRAAEFADAATRDEVLVSR